MNIIELIDKLKEEAIQLKELNSNLAKENERLNQELNTLYSRINPHVLTPITKSSELIDAIESRYANTGMKVVTCLPQDKTFILEFGEWSWPGAVRFNGKQYFNKTRFYSYDIDGYDDPYNFICELLKIKELPTHGIADNWYCHSIPIPDNFEFDKILK